MGAIGFLLKNTFINQLAFNQAISLNAVQIE